MNSLDLDTLILGGFGLPTWGRLVLDLVACTLVIRVCYGLRHRRHEYVFTYYAFNVITCLLCLLLRQAPLQSGVGLALFGVFGILRYRTEQIRLRDLTYLFIVIGLGLLNGVADPRLSLPTLGAVNAVVVGLTWLLERRGRGGVEVSTPLLYDRLELLHPGRTDELLADIAARTGMRVTRVEIEQVDLIRDAAQLTVFHAD